ncbi:hypothetical protein [Peribacillus simplex]|uniref:hypothetical protein n=1 Tax=Peribacillus simplex TaxID=1478 RepID=UPI0024C1DB3C|nr:hypothetical protein [Peribacillus simplex]WHY58556.1 hypothetical protein QNH43_09995 [Peribacillus simplex]
MQIIINEIKKILNWKMILVLFLVNAVLYFLLINFHIENFPNGRPDLDSYNISVEMIRKYGINMDEEEMADFKKTYDNQVKEADQFLQSSKEFRDAGIRSYEEFRNMDLENEKQSVLHGKIFFDEKVDMFWELQERERLIEFHDQNKDIINNSISDANPRQKERLLEIKTNGSYDVFPETVFYNFKDFILNVTIAIIVSVVMVMSPIIIQDRSRQLIDLQYTAKTGRSLYKKKAVAGLLSTLIVITALLAVYFSIYSLNNTAMFFSVPIYTFIGEYYWYDLSFIQYIVLTVIAIYILGIVFALLAMSFSTIAPNFIALIGVQIPIVLAMLAFGLGYLINSMISYGLPKWLVPISYGVLIAVSVLFIILLWKRERKMDIVQ